MKMYIEHNCHRPIPVGYSAADDLKFRVSLSEYLECVDSLPLEAVDFYGINSYQWCGLQSFYTSGYNVLVNDFRHYARPVFFSEYGCNEVTPRLFEETQSLYLLKMIDSLCGGLIYEFTQQENNYGLVEILPNEDVRLLPDFIKFKTMLATMPDLDYWHIAHSMRKNARDILKNINTLDYALPRCRAFYANINVSRPMPPSAADHIIRHRADVVPGNFVNLSSVQMSSPFSVYGPAYELFGPCRPIDITVDLHSTNLETRVRVVKKKYHRPLDVVIKTDASTSIDPVSTAPISFESSRKRMSSKSTFTTSSSRNSRKHPHRERKIETCTGNNCSGSSIRMHSGPSLVIQLQPSGVLCDQGKCDKANKVHKRWLRNLFSRASRKTKRLFKAIFERNRE